MTVVTILLVFTFGFMSAAAALYLLAKAPSMRKPRWLSVLAGEVPWSKSRSATYLGDVHGEHKIFPVGRHEIAEVGLWCPICYTEAAERGDFSRVERMVIDGIENEVIHCKGFRMVLGSEEPRPCGTILVASPDTEHGDHLNNAGEIDRTSPIPPEYHRFVRVAPARVLAEKYGIDIQPDQVTGELRATGTAEQLEKAKNRKDDITTPEQILAYLQANPESGTPIEVTGGLAASASAPAPRSIDPDRTPINGTHIKDHR
jgi:hypothetical protein